MGGFLLFSILVTYLYPRMFHVEHSTENRPGDLSIKAYCQASRLLLLFVFIQLLALLTTFSKSAVLCLLVAAAYITYHTIVPRGTINLPSLIKLFHVEQFGRKLLLICGIILALGLIFKPDTNSLLFKSLNERLFYLSVSHGTILANPIIGVGNGQFVLDLSKYVPRGTIVQDWQYQPVHNVFLLIWSELGIIGLVIFLWLLWQLFHVEQSIAKPAVKCSTWNNDGCEVYEPIGHTNVPRGTFLTKRHFLVFLKGLFLGLIFIMLFDHYLWDIQQGEILLWLLFGLLAGQCFHTIDIC